jgi:hypothetical protein
MILYCKKCISRVNASLRWFNNIVSMYFVEVSLLLIGHQGLGHFFRYRPLLPFGWRIVKILRQLQRKATNTVPTTLSAIQAASQSTFIDRQLYYTFD